jgi:hypothetical protein
MRPLIVVCGMLAMAALVVALSRNARRDGGRAVSGDAIAGAASSTDLDELRAEVRELKARVNRPAPQIVLATGASAASAPPTSLEDLQRQQVATVDSQAKNIEDHLAHERIDVDWSGKVVAAFREVFRAKVPGTQLDDAQCGSTLCKLSLSHTTVDAQIHLGDVMAKVAPVRAEMLYRYHEDPQHPTTVLYVAREGTTLPVGEQ